MIPAAGSLLVSTIMVLPASIALKLGKNFRWGHADCVIIGFIGMFSGLILSLYCRYTKASASITLLFVALVLACESWITFEEVDMNVKKNLVGYC